MPQKIYLDDNGNPIPPRKTYLDDSGNPIGAADPNQAIKDRQATYQSPREGGWQDVALDQMSRVAPGALKAVTGIPAFAASVVGAGGNPRKQVELLKGAAYGIGSPFATSITGAAALAMPDKFQSPDAAEFLQASEDAGTQLGGAILQPVAANSIAALKNGASKIPNVAPNFTAVTLPRRIMSSLLKPDKRAFDFGADPIKEILDLGFFNPSANLSSLKAKVGNAMATQETALTAQLKARTKGSLSEGVPNTENVAPAITAPLDEAIALARRDANPALAKRIERFRDARIKDLTDKYGSTYLTPDQILKEKRILRDEVKFTPDAIQQNLNTAKMGMYRGYDSVLDKMIPEAKSINQRYAGLIEADKLLDSRIIQANKAPLISKEGIAFTGAKTTLADIFKRKGLMNTPAGEAIFGPKRQMLNAGTPMPSPTELPSGGFEMNVTPAAIAPATREIRTGRLLNAGKPLPPPTDTSGVTGTVADLAPATRDIRTGRLLESGKPLPPPTDTSTATGTRTNAQPATRDIRTGRILKAGTPLAPGSEPPSGGFSMNVETGRPTIQGGYGDFLEARLSGKKVRSGPARGMSLSHIDMDPITGEPKTYVYVDASGKQLRFSSKQD